MNERPSVPVRHRHLRRLAVELAILVALIIVDAVAEEALIDIVAVVLVVFPAINWTVAAILVWSARQAPDVQSLSERADDALTLALVSTSGAVVGVITIGRALGVNFNLGKPILVSLAFGFILVSVPAIEWLRTWRNVWMPMVRSRREVEKEKEKAA